MATPGTWAVRYFDFADVSTSYGDGLRTIVAALDDEGLQLLDTGSQSAGQRITTVLIDGVKRFVVPTARIVPKGAHLEVLA